MRNGPPGAGPRRGVHRRLRSLAALELINIPLQGLLWFGPIGVPATAANLTGFALVAVLLGEGAGYWLAKLRQLAGRGSHLPGLAAFRAARLANPVLLLAGLAVTGRQAVADPGSGSWPGLAFALFAVLEHVNYFHIQLTHDTRADLRRLRSSGLHSSHLARDLRRRRAPGGS